MRGNFGVPEKHGLIGRKCGGGADFKPCSGGRAEPAFRLD